MRRKLIALLLIAFIPLCIFAQPASEKEEPFKLLDEYQSEIFGTTFYTYEHEETGFNVIYEENSSGENFASFMVTTPMQDEGDLNHVFEHSILSGSEKYPSSYLLFDMIQRSYITYTNAATSRGYTFYFGQSPSYEQIKIYIDAIMSCILSPDLIRNENIYRREAIRYDLESPDSSISPAGTVFNEDVGYISSPYNVHYDGIGKALYGTTRYANSIGKLPENLKYNTYQRIKDIFNDYYNWDNIILYIYGNVDIDDILDMLDKEYLSVYEKPQTDLSKYEEEVGDGFRELYYPIPARSDYKAQDGDAIITYAFDLGAFDATQFFALSPLASELAKDGGLLDEEIERLDVDGNVSVTTNPIYARPTILFILSNTDLDQKDKFKDAVDSAIARAASGELDTSSIINRVESLKKSIGFESSNGASAENNNRLIMTAKVYFNSLDAIKLYSNSLDLITQDNYASSLFNILKNENTLRALVTSFYESGLYEEKIENISKELDEMKKSLSQDEIDELVKESKAYYEWVGLSYANEDISIDRNDVASASLDITIDEIDGDGVKYTVFEVEEEKDIVSFSLSFPSSHLSTADKNYLGLYAVLLLNMDTGKHSHMEIEELADKYLYSYTITFEVFDKEPYFTIQAYADKKDLDQALSLLFELLEDSEFTKEAIKRYLPEIAEGFNLRRILTSSSAVSPLVRQIGTEEGLYTLDMLFNGLYDYTQSVINDIDDESYASSLIDNIERVRDSLLRKGSVKVQIIANKESAESAINIISKYISKLEEEERKDSNYEYLSLGSSIAILTNASTGNLTYAIKLSENEEIKGEYLPYLIALTNSELLSLRTGGGTYSVGNGTSLTNNLNLFYTLSDSTPNLSLNAFLSAFDNFKAKSMSEEDLNASSLSMLSSLQIESRGAIDKADVIYMILERYGKERGENLLNGAKFSDLSDKDQALNTLKEAFENNGTLVYVGPSALFEGIKDHFELVLDFT